MSEKKDFCPPADTNLDEKKKTDKKKKNMQEINKKKRLRIRVWKQLNIRNITFWIGCNYINIEIQNSVNTTVSYARRLKYTVLKAFLVDMKA